jgi:RNA polymerase sigma-70 factor (ECF subfamily)
MKTSEKEKLFLQLLQENKDKIYRLCYGYLINKSEADDLFQEVMVNIWKNIESFRGQSQISTWVFRITVNSALMYNKKLTKQNIFGNLEMDTLTAQPHIEEDIDEKLAALHRCIAVLKKQDRLIISLLLEGLSYNEIAEITGITLNYVGVKINRIKQTLEKLMKNEKF